MNNWTNCWHVPVQTLMTSSSSYMNICKHIHRYSHTHTGIHMWIYICIAICESASRHHKIAVNN